MNIESHICEMYSKEKKSTYEIASILGEGWYSQKVRRILKRNGVKLRGKSESQTNVLKSGRASHPTKGKHHSTETKSKIGHKISEVWDNLTPEEKEYRSNIGKVNWNLLTKEEKKKLADQAAKAVRKAAQEGSKVEKYVLAKLRMQGWKVEYHTELVLPTKKLEIDFFLRDILTAIEIDGPSHFKDIWSPEHLARTMLSDRTKNALLMQNGYNVLRIRTKVNKVTNVYCEKLWDRIVPILDGLKENFRKNIEERLTIIEV